MPQIFLATRLIELGADQDIALDDGHHGFSVLSGTLSGRNNTVGAGEGAYCGTPARLGCSGPTRFVVFSLYETMPSHDCLSIEVIEMEARTAVFRLDRVSFPAGAIAYRHVHAGPGTRYLTTGTFEVASDHGAQLMMPGDAWFEGADSPVRATASPSEDTAFIRATVLPLDYLGKPSIKYLNRADDDKPRLQTNTRFFDQIIEF